MGGPYSGVAGSVNGISTVQDWSITDGHTPQEYSASNTLFGMGAVPGIEFWEGGYNHYGHTPVVLPGQQFYFIGYGAPLNNVSGSGWRYAGSALCNQAVINWNWASGAIIAVQESFKGHLDLVEQGDTGSQILDESIPTVPKIACTKIEYSLDDSTFVEWDNLVSASLTLTNELQDYINSSTVVDDAGTCRIWTGRRRGRYNWTLAVTEQDVRRDLFSKGQVLMLRLYVTSSLYYELKWGMMRDVTGIQVNRQTGAIVQQTVNFSMCGMDTDAGSYAAATGHVLMPGGEQWWPLTGTGTGT